MRGRLIVGALVAWTGAAGVWAGAARAEAPADPEPQAAAQAEGAPAAPAPASPAPASPGKPPGPADFSHKGQLQLSARFALGLRTIVTYDNAAYCGDTDPQGEFGFASVCTGRAPLGLDLELGYGVGRRVDLLLELRLGLERDFGATPAGSGGPRMLHLSPGVRVFFSESSRAKLFATAQLVVDFAGYQEAGGAGRGNDFGVRSLSGLWVDLAREYGFYVFVGETASFARWMRFELEGGIGISGRYP